MSEETKRMREVRERRSLLSPIKVYCTKAQREVIEAYAKRAGMSLSTYLQRMGSQYTPAIHSACRDDIEKLIKINADLGRLGGLIKLWLTNDQRTRLIGEAQLRETLHQIASTQNKMLDALSALKQSKI